MLRVPGFRTALALAALGAIATACEEASDPVALPTTRAQEQSELFVEQVPISQEEIGAAVLPEARNETPASPAPRTSRRMPPRPPRAPAVTSPEAAAESPHAESQVPLDVLLRTPLEPGPPKNPLVLGEPGEPPVAAAPPASGLERWKDSVRIERHSESYGVTGPRQGTLSQTEAGVRIPVDDSISVNGGVRVDQREQPGAPPPERISGPQVGVEIKF
ncbi:MAG TPA: hypothetical protein VMW19_13140 [Myxococcota bacterium]|nr:hypothetical protein [Myxococcota bacterium]